MIVSWLGVSRNLRQPEAYVYLPVFKELFLGLVDRIYLTNRVTYADFIIWIFVRSYQNKTKTTVWSIHRFFQCGFEVVKLNLGCLRTGRGEI